MDDVDDERALAAATEELAETLEALRAELEGPPRGPLGVPRPPAPRELFRFTEGYAIPALIAVLEANVRLFEALAAAMRVADGRPLDGGALDGESVGDRRRGRLARTGQSALGTLENALEELAVALERGEPSNPEALRLLEEARTLREEVEGRLAETGEVGGERALDEKNDEYELAAGDDSETDEIGIDIDEEIASIREELDDETEDCDDGTARGE